MSASPEPDDHSNRARPPLQPPPGSSTNRFMSTLSFFTEPVTYTVSGLIRRLSDDDAPTPLAHALSANYGGGSAAMPGSIYTPPPRRLSPFQPPPLTPLSLHGYKAGTHGKARLLRNEVAEEIRLLIPPRLQLVDRWQLAYSLEQDGSTLKTLYANCDALRGRRGGFVLVVRDAGGGVCGAYLSDAPKPQAHYFGNGECFLWRVLVLPALNQLPDLASLPPPPSADTTHLQRMTTIASPTSDRKFDDALLDVPSANGTNGHANDGAATPDLIRFKAFPYTGENDFTIFCQHEYLSVGGGDGHYGLWLDDNLGTGVSETCPTFGNEGLSDEGHQFDVLGVEVWYVGA